MSITNAVTAPPTGGAVGDVYKVIFRGTLPDHRCTTAEMLITVIDACTYNELTLVAN